MVHDEYFKDQSKAVHNIKVFVLDLKVFTVGASLVSSGS